MDWQYKKFPTVVGYYWFYGDRWKNNNGKTRNILFCVLHTVGIGNHGGIMIANGNFMYESELGKDWWFCQAIVPMPPNC